MNHLMSLQKVIHQEAREVMHCYSYVAAVCSRPAINNPVQKPDTSLSYDNGPQVVFIVCGHCHVCAYEQFLPREFYV